MRLAVCAEPPVVRLVCLLRQGDTNIGKSVVKTKRESRQRVMSMGKRCRNVERSHRAQKNRKLHRIADKYLDAQATMSLTTLPLRVK